MVDMLAITTTPDLLAEMIMKCPDLRCAVKRIILRDIDEQCQKLCTRSQEKWSVLRIPRSKHKDLKNFSWNSIILELYERAPDVLDFLVTVALPKGTKKCEDKYVPAICEGYGVLMNVRWQELSLIQKINTILLGVGHTIARTFQRLNKVGITQTRESYRLIMDDIGADLKNTIANQLSAGRQFRVCFDNMDFRVLVNIILKNHQNSDKHWIAHYLTFDRVSCQRLDNDKPLVSDSRAFDNINYLLSKDELETLRNNFIVLVARVLLEFFDFMKPFVKAVPAHIKHRYSGSMKEKSTIVALPVVPFNQSKLADVCQYLDYLQEEGTTNMRPDMKVPLAGDLLGRERVTGAKRVRMGCDQPEERYDNIAEIPALWHAKQAFLKFVWEELYKPTAVCGREVGTLYHLRQCFKLINVPSDVRKNYASCEMLMLSATKSYLCSAFLTWAEIKTTKETPSYVKETMKTDASTSADEHWQFLQGYLGKFVDEFVLTKFDIERKWEEEMK
ncbi:uncharacterized protein LOC114953141 isoform X2 [Acropora millepora]|uniref:uncharacterized protein LOC114953141 isoform X2 n=1 Tax=Acropora millepora TaxID=45264 RepID=UPI001CF1CCBB|nr:uncharacterized protein LOC114953141 isoform X2 [Acropora millepora]